MTKYVLHICCLDNHNILHKEWLGKWRLAQAQCLIHAKCRIQEGISRILGKKVARIQTNRSSIRTKVYLSQVAFAQIRKSMALQTASLQGFFAFQKATSLPRFEFHRDASSHSVIFKLWQGCRFCTEILYIHSLDNIATTLSFQIRKAKPENCAPLVVDL